MSNVNDVPDALRLADWLEDQYDPTFNLEGAAVELRRLHAEHEEDQSVIAVWRGRTQRAEEQRDKLLEAYAKMRNSAAGYSNYCDDNALTRRCERDYTAAEDLYRAAIKAVEENQ